MKILGCMGGLLLAGLGSAAIITTETFDIDEAGFGPNTIASVVAYSAAGGNPDGHIQTRRDLGEPFFDIGALTTDTRFTGDYGADGIGSMRVDLNFMTANFTGAWFRVRIDAVGNGWLFPLTAAFPTNVWNTYGVAFNPTWTDLEARASGWVTDEDLDPLATASPSFATVMAAVGYAEVRLGSTNESSLAGIDNFGLGAPVPEPSTVILLGCGLGLIAVRRWRAKTQ